MDKPFCKYKNIFGEPNKGWREKHRILGISYIDALVVIVFGIAISYIFNIPLSYTLVFLFILGIIFHRLFCVRTTMDIYLFG
jgi:hypothetical protein